MKKCEESEGPGLYILAISEIGVCYIWFGNNVDELWNAKPTKVSVSLEFNSSKIHKAALPAIFAKIHKAALPAIFAAKLQGFDKPSSGHLFLGYGLLVKPSFQKHLVQSGTDKIELLHSTVQMPRMPYFLFQRYLVLMLIGKTLNL